jgi:hypothetical protein
MKSDQTTRARLRAAWRAVRGDGCTNSPELTYHRCCLRHDADYTAHCDENGLALTRSQADARLFECMKKSGVTPVIGKFLLPALYWSAVRIFGGKHWKKSPSQIESKSEEPGAL